ncbi:uncharacterized protein LOC103855486 isoform X1 [Brassica rapa]|uniref:uncharacterized protein LOC103855486 isoform X1 n=1 Tax=Brassica campestris TaxID=3711 RepID=UPI00142D78F5|nr:uncharacterized protein LOC103855486 isoform X1 [Brassica rapa]
MASLARRAMSLAQIPSARVPASVCQRRGLAGAADHHGSTKVDFWKQPTNPGNWKEEHVPFISPLFSVCVFIDSFLTKTKSAVCAYFALWLGIALLQWLQTLHRRQACAMNLSPGKDKTALLLVLVLYQTRPPKLLLDSLCLLSFKIIYMLLRCIKHF